MLAIVMYEHFTNNTIYLLSGSLLQWVTNHPNLSFNA